MKSLPQKNTYIFSLNRITINIHLIVLIIGPCTLLPCALGLRDFYDQDSACGHKCIFWTSQLIKVHLIW